ncbi:MAG TPA: hypothetical protein VN783_09310 [Thermoanaerobaculia bacterium]|nr:hypothetical protein [Thermoanaerobaculia bacterium]
MAEIGKDGTLIVVSDSGKFYRINLAARTVDEIPDTDPNYKGIARRADSKDIVAEVDSGKEQAEFASPIMFSATFVNLKLLG